MRLAVKPISSPGRAEKFPPPLMRFMRTNVGSRSRGRSRSSPMFVLRKKSTAMETQEPSSPKVTCMGQVRVRRSKTSGAKSTRTSRTQTPSRRRCRWIRNSLSCYHFNKKFKKPKSLRSVWRKWVLFFHVDFKGRRSENRGKSPKFGNKSEDLEQEDEEEDDQEIIEEADRVYASTSISSPPKNALLLTRSRSAPYRSSSLASRFWGSPLASEETEQQQNQEEQETEQDESIEDENPASKTESITENSGPSPNSRTDPETDPLKIATFADLDGSESESVRERFSSDARIEEVKAAEEEAETTRPSILTRCKSEPARIAARLDPELNFWKKRRLGFT